MNITNHIGKWIIRTSIQMMGIVLMIIICAVQAVGTILTAISAIVLKSISALMIVVTLMLLIFGLFTWMKTLVVLLIAGSMFWVPEGMVAMMIGLSYVQRRLVDLIEAY